MCACMHALRIYLYNTTQLQMRICPPPPPYKTQLVHTVVAESQIIELMITVPLPLRPG